MSKEDTEKNTDHPVEKFLKEIKVESILNREDDQLPYAYFHPGTEGRLTWICGPDAEGRITSVTAFDKGTHTEKQCKYLKDIEEAKIIRDDVIKNGWQKLKPPEITFSYNEKDKGKPLNRKQKRFLKRKLKKMDKKNPFK